MKTIMASPYKAVLHAHTAVGVDCEIVELIRQIDPTTRQPIREKIPFVKNGVVVVCRIQVSNLMCIEKFSDFPQLGRLTLRTEGNTQCKGEHLSSMVTFFKRLGITSADVGFKVSSRKVLQEVLHRYSTPENLFGKVCITIDKLEKIPIDEIKRDLKLVGMREEACEELLQVLSVKSLSKLEEILGSSGDAIAELKQLFSLADRFGYSDWIQFDASVVRGLAYYTGIVFEGFDRKGKLRAICGCGRYDRLMSTYGGDDVPACGFGFGDAVIMEMCSKVVPPSSVMVAFETLLSSDATTIDDEAGNPSWQARADFYIRCILSSLPWGGAELIEALPGAFPAVVAGAVRALFERIVDLYMECRMRLILWFSHHL